MKNIDILLQMKKRINEVEEYMLKSMNIEQDILKVSSTHLLSAGGKRLRPIFVLLSGDFGNPDLNNLKKAAAALEFIHMATLVHDDVIDNANTRRGKLTVKAKWNDNIAMYTGDFIFAQALTILADFDDKNIQGLISKSIVLMCEGEIEQINDLHYWNQSYRRYLKRIRRKTAILIAVSCKLGALVSNVEESTSMKIYLYGYYLGMAFQIIDDILDFISTEETLGKPVGSDLIQGNITLPVLYAIKCSERNVKENLIKNINQYFKLNNDKLILNEILKTIHASGGIEFSYKIAQRYIDKAKKIISDLPNIPAKRAMIEIADFVIERKF